MGKIMHGGIEYSGGGPGGGGAVNITPTLSTGTKIADYSIDGVSGELYAPQVGGGTEVIANPTGEPTAELTKVSIGGVIYSLPQGGGGGSAFEKVIISQALVDRPTERVIIEQQQ